MSSTSPYGKKNSQMFGAIGFTNHFYKSLYKSLFLAEGKSLWYNTPNTIALAALLSREVEGPAL